MNTNISETRRARTIKSSDNMHNYWAYVMLCFRVGSRFINLFLISANLNSILSKSFCNILMLHSVVLSQVQVALVACEVI